MKNVRLKRIYKNSIEDYMLAINSEQPVLIRITSVDQLHDLCGQCGFSHDRDKSGDVVNKR